jgi:hypothetical protein
MTATCFRVIFIQSFLSFIVDETSSKNRINTTVVKGIIEDDVLSGLDIICDDDLYWISRAMESLSLEIDNNIFVPYVIIIDQKNGFVMQGILCHIFLSQWREGHI